MYVWTYVCMDGYMDGWICMGGCVFVWMCVCMDGWMYVWMDRWMDVCMYVSICVCVINTEDGILVVWVCVWCEFFFVLKEFLVMCCNHEFFIRRTPICIEFWK
jgi:hypothetical protein